MICRGGACLIVLRDRAKLAIWLQTAEECERVLARSHRILCICRCWNTPRRNRAISIGPPQARWERMQFDQVDGRHFIALVANTAVGWPPVMYAQEPIITLGNRIHVQWLSCRRHSRMAAVQQGVKELGMSGAYPRDRISLVRDQLTTRCRHASGGGLGPQLISQNCAVPATSRLKRIETPEFPLDLS
jgi:hypothetical protein